MIRFRYSQVFDLVCHTLAYMPVNNPSNLYSRSYIQKMLAEGVGEGLEKKLESLQPYYQAHFDRLCMINFLPFCCDTLDELVQLLESYEQFTREDMACFIHPFCCILREEHGAYALWWQRKFDETEEARRNAQAWFQEAFAGCQPFFSHSGKAAMAGFSFSMTCNGRGFGSEKFLQAYVPFPEGEAAFQDTFFQLLHEFTHQVTDPICSRQIRMDDGSHLLSEKAVMLFDYFFLQKVIPQRKEAYLRWVAALVQADECPEALFLSAFSTRAEMDQRLMMLAEEMCGQP